MPELPEVETIRRQLDKVLAGQVIGNVQVLQKKSLQGETLKVVGKRILGVERKAKMIIIRLSGELNLLIHLKMTGQLVYTSKFEARSTKFETKYTRVIFELDKGRFLFNDLRLFGWIKIVNDKQIKEILGKMPPDVVDKEFTPHLLQNILRSSGQAVKIVLMDQQKIGGIGNIYANESLFASGINPTRRANKITKEQVKKLHENIKKVINQGIKYGGSTASDENFVNALGKPGKYQEHFLAYERQGKQCHKCGSVIKKIKLGGRGTYFCQKCQK